jgi:hypothetical protein
MNERQKYLRHVGFWLPSRCRSELLADIAADLDEHLEEAERQNGKALEPDEVRAALHRFGSPPVVATRYSPARPLVSGGLMTVYQRVLSVAVLGVLLGQLLVTLPGFADAGPGEHGAHMVAAGHRAITGLLLAFTSVTLVFAALTRIYWRQPSLQ